jgi:long-chain fatty acid transport protein
MKSKQIVVAILLMFVSTAAWAGGVIHNSNQSTEYDRTLTRNAATDSADIAHYNPAGLVWMQDGFYLNMGNQFIFKEYSHGIEGVDQYYKFKDTDPIYLFPGVFAVFKKGPLALFTTFTVPAGGGSFNYKDGIIFGTSPQEDINAEGFAAHYAVSMGASYKFSKMFSLGMALRLVSATGSVDANGTLFGNTGTLQTYEVSSLGFGGVISLNFRPMKNLLLAARYETRVVLDWEYDNYEFVLGGDAPGDYREDLPPVIGLGASYKFNQFRFEANMNIYLNKMATWEDPENENYSEDEFDNGFEISTSVAWSLNKMFEFSFGAMYTNSGADKYVYDMFRPQLDCITVGGGLRARLMDNLDINLALTTTNYFDDTLDSDKENDSNPEIDLTKWTSVIAFSLQYRFDLNTK